MSEKYFMFSLEYKIYLMFSDKQIRISVPAYDIFDKECFFVENINGAYKFRYYNYTFDQELSGNYKYLKVYDKKVDKKYRVYLLEIDKKEYKNASIKVDRKQLLLEVYECSCSCIIDYKYEIKEYLINSFYKLDYQFFEVSNSLFQIEQGVRWLLQNFTHISKDQYDSELCLKQLFEKKYNKKIHLNCKNLAVLLNSLYLSWGFKTRYIICLQKEEKVNNAHFLVEVYVDNLTKWIAVDSSYGLFFTDIRGEYLSLREIRENIAHDKITLIKYVDLSIKVNSILYFRSFICKLYRFRRSLVSNGYYLPNIFVELIPKCTHSLLEDGVIYTDNPEMFWGR